jgi:hypothetical protein
MEKKKTNVVDNKIIGYCQPCICSCKQLKKYVLQISCPHRCVKDGNICD